jgi:hypothetical protein
MRLAIGLLLLGCCVGRTAQVIPTYRTDRDVWEAAVEASPRLPRPALNLATAYRKEGRTRDAVLWLVRAGDLSAGAPREVELRYLIKSQLLFLSAFGDDVCGRPAVQPYCF